MKEYDRGDPNKDYINLEKAINKLERKNVLKKYESQSIYVDNLKNAVEQLEAVLKELKKQTSGTRIFNIVEAAVDIGFGNHESEAD
ncbi:hypothetical protein KIN20_019763 [Parelaphostrongylus tenuis]|uniref:Uncharacterized protein n=1 Tax=Parelaphostrongylus tenuis TaxID=148309 RepID=A0AAD5MLH4_PARTN|nr:hypothetical protein KIN20_019763 [Parelaphostrongylus tenuis]